MNSAIHQAATTSELQQRKNQVSLWYTMLLTGVVCGAYMPLAYWGFDGILLSIWIGIIGLALMHGYVVEASGVIVLGILCSINAELPLSSVQRQTIASPNSGMQPSDLIIPLAGIFGVGVFAMAAIAWMMTTMPQDVRRALNSLFGVDDDYSGLQQAQFTLFHLFGLMTVVCLAAAPIFYGGMAAGFSTSPLILLGGMLLVYRKYGFAIGIFVILVIGILIF